MSFIVKDVKTVNRGKALEPLKAEFVHGDLNTSLLATSQRDITMKVGLFGGLNEHSYTALCQDSTGMCYKADAVAPRVNGAPQLFIAVLNKATNKVKLVQMSKASFFPVVKAPASTNSVLLQDNEEKEKKAAVTGEVFVHKFGLLRGQRMYDQASRLTVEAETVRANLESASSAANAVEKDDLLPKNAGNFADLLPPRNDLAISGAEVYDIETIMTEYDFNSLEDLGMQMITSWTDGSYLDVWKEEGLIFSQYFLIEHARLNESSFIDDEDKLRLMKVLLYTECLINLAKTKKRTVESKDLPYIFPAGVKMRIIEKFLTTSGMKRFLSKMDKEKVACHVIILAFIISNCSFSVDILSTSLEVTVDTLVPLIRVVGGHVVKDKMNDSTSTATLTLPLAAPMKKGPPVKKNRQKMN